MQLVDSKLYVANATRFGTERQHLAAGCGNLISRLKRKRFGPAARDGAGGVCCDGESGAVGDGSIDGFSFASDFVAGRACRADCVSNFWQIG
jgi:hypothetical protein